MSRVLLLLVVLAGCSFMQASASPHLDPLTKKPACVSRGMPAVDIVFAAFYAGMPVALLSNLDEKHIHVSDVKFAGIVTLFGAASITHIVSSIYGFKKIGRCRRQLAESGS
jgi:hypothetical protein